MAAARLQLVEFKISSISEASSHINKRPERQYHFHRHFAWQFFKYPTRILRSIQQKNMTQKSSTIVHDSYVGFPAE